ncbi:MAG: hypothetical protein WB424_00875 [Terracidiphilus sp.]|jgi:hypothetical protein
MKMKYKRRTIFVHKDESVSHFIDLLNRMGSDGWETISIWADELGNHVLLKKPLAV